MFENLIENAAKYIGAQPNLLIEIGTRQEKNERVVFVKDNGIGIEKRYHTRVIALFEKLNPNIEGTGIGLAIVKRIIETHGGKIWVESDGLWEKALRSALRFQMPENKAIKLMIIFEQNVRRATKSYLTLFVTKGCD